VLVLLFGFVRNLHHFFQHARREWSGFGVFRRARARYVQDLEVMFTDELDQFVSGFAIIGFTCEIQMGLSVTDFREM
jgi:hypothetical protein